MGLVFCSLFINDLDDGIVGSYIKFEDKLNWCLMQENKNRIGSLLKRTKKGSKLISTEWKPQQMKTK